jgi:hypothetical protein
MTRMDPTAAARRRGSILEIDVGERHAGIILHDEAGVRFLDSPGSAMRAMHRMRTKGATIQHPGWGGADLGFFRFPVDKMTLRH